MRFYTRQHVHYCGIDLHARSLYVCILNQEGEVLVHRKPPCDREQLVKTLAPYRQDLVVAVECLFCWYWVADLYSEQGTAFILDHALHESDPRRKGEERPDCRNTDTLRYCMQLILCSNCSDSTASTALWLDVSATRKCQFGARVAEAPSWLGLYHVRSRHRCGFQAVWPRSVAKGQAANPPILRRRATFKAGDCFLY